MELTYEGCSMSKMSFRRLSLRRVLFVLSGILVHYVGYSFYRVYSFIMSDIITLGIITSGIEYAVRLPRCFKTKNTRRVACKIGTPVFTKCIYTYFIGTKFIVETT